MPWNKSMQVFGWKWPAIVVGQTLSNRRLRRYAIFSPGAVGFF
jgi:hypothetical protein